MSNELEVGKRKIQLSWNLLHYFLDPTSISQEFLDVQLHRNIITFRLVVKMFRREMNLVTGTCVEISRFSEYLRVGGSHGLNF